MPKIDISSLIAAHASNSFQNRLKFEDDRKDLGVPPFLKWAGGKRWLIPLALKIRSLEFNCYFEPFLGSGAMFFGIAPKRSVLSDTNSALVETYQAIKDDWNAVEKGLKAHHFNHSKEYYYSVRDQRPRVAHTKAARFIYLNRTCWNGLYRVNRQGRFNTPVGSKKEVILESDNFKLIASRLKSAKLFSGDFEKQIDSSKKGDLIFSDPPYTVRHEYNGFVKYNEQLFSWEDQERLCAALVRAKKRGVAVICTNADHASIRELYGSDFTLLRAERYSAIAGRGGDRGTYPELLISN